MQPVGHAAHSREWIGEPGPIDHHYFDIHPPDQGSIISPISKNSMMKRLLLLSGLLIFFASKPLPADAAAWKAPVENIAAAKEKTASPTHFTKANKKGKRADRRQKRFEKKLDKWKNKLRRGDRINLAWVGILVMLVGGLFIVLGLVIPYVGLLFLVLGIIIAFVGLLLVLLLKGLTVDAS